MPLKSVLFLQHRVKLNRPGPVLQTETRRSHKSPLALPVFPLCSPHTLPASAMAVASTLNLSFMASCSSSYLRYTIASKAFSSHISSLRATPTCFTRFSGSSSSLALPACFLSQTKNKFPVSLCTVNETSSLALQDEEEDDVDVSKWEMRDDAEEGIPGDEGFGEGQSEDLFPKPLGETKLFVGNLPCDVDSEKLAHLFEKGGMVEVSEVIYSRKTGESRCFGFVTMSTVEEADKAVEMFHRFDLNGKLLTVNKASPRGSSPPPGNCETSFRVYVTNLPWQVDDTSLEQVFSKHGKVVNARVVYDRETGRSRGFGYVSMSSQSELDDAIAALDGQSLDGRSIKVCVAEERQPHGQF